MNKVITYFIITLSFLTFSHRLNAGEMRILISNFDSQSVSRDLSSMVTEWVRTAMSNSGYIIIDQSKISEIVKQHEIQMTGLVDDTNAVKIGKLLSANKILTGSVSKIGIKFVISGRIIDVEKGTSKYGHREYTWKISDLDFCTQRFSDNIIKKMKGKYLPAKKTYIKKITVLQQNPVNEKKLVLKTLKTMYDAYINKDLDAYLTYIDDNARFWCSAYNLRGKRKIKAFRKNETFAKYDNFKYKLKNVQITINGQYATVYDTYVLSFRIIKSGRQFRESARERFKLVKKGNSWYILENQEY
jgi:ketosteroid isomerase-like protein/TolB-like protein